MSSKAEIKKKRALRKMPPSLVSLLIFVLISNMDVGVFCFAVASRKSVSYGPRMLEMPPLAKEKARRKRTQLGASATTGASNESQDIDGTAQYIRGGGGEIPANSARRWISFDALDQQLLKVAVPCIINFAIAPLVGAVDLFWVNRMGNPLAVAGQAAANQMYNSAFWLASFLPSVTARQVAEDAAKGDKDAVQDSVCQALFVGSMIALLGTPFVFFNPDGVLRAVLKDGSPAHAFAKPYLLIRAFSFLPGMMSLISFSAFRGILDTVTPVKISAFSNLLNAVLDPILMFTFAMGVTGAAYATLAAELTSCVIFLTILRRRRVIKMRKIFKIPSWKKLEPLLKGGAALQLRNLALQITFLSVTRVTQAVDQTGVAAAAHALAIQTFQVGGVVLLGLSTAAQTLVPNEMVEKYDESKGRTIGGKQAARAVVNRLMNWGLVLGVLLGAFQLMILPFLHKATPIVEVREAARLPSILASIYQIINGLVFIGEGVMVGCGNFLQLSISTVIATIGCVVGLRTFPSRFGLAGVWMSFGVFNILRLMGVWLHQARLGPLARRNMEGEMKLS